MTPPEPWCDPTCPRQITRMNLDCECGGARRQWEAHLTYKENHKGRSAAEDGITLLPSTDLAGPTARDQGREVLRTD